MPVLVGVENAISRQKRLVLKAKDIDRVLAATWPKHEATCLKRRWIAKVDADEACDLACDRFVFIRRDAPIAREDGAQPWTVLGMAVRTIDGVGNAKTCDASDDGLRFSRCNGVHVKCDKVTAFNVCRFSLETFQRTADKTTNIF